MQVLGQHVAGYNFNSLFEEMASYGIPPIERTFELLLNAYHNAKVVANRLMCPMLPSKITVTWSPPGH